MTITSPRSSAVSYPPAPRDWPDWRGWLTQIADVINGLQDGKTNACFTQSLTANAASTTVSNARIRAGSALILVPTTANAAAAIATTYQTYPNITDGQAVLTHTNNAQTDRTFRVVIAG